LVVQPDGKLLVGGNFSTLQPNGAANWTTRLYAARLNTDGTLDANFDLGLDERSGNNVTHFRLQADGKILVSGGFLSLQPAGTATRVARSHLVRLNNPATGAVTLDAAFSPAANGPATGAINALAVQADGRIIAAGAFNDLGGAGTANIARFTPEGTLDPTFARASGADGPINAVALRANPTGLTPQLPGLVWLDAAGTLRPAFRPSATLELSGQITCFAFQADGKLLLGGSFTSLTGATGSNLIRLNADGSLDAAFAPAPNGPVDAITLQNDRRILLAGGFTIIGGATRNRIARVQLDGTVDAFDPNANGRVSAILEQPNGQILVAGQFTTLQPNSSTTTVTTTSTTVPADRASTTTVTNADGSTTTTAVSISGTTTTKTVTTAVNPTATARNSVARLTTDGDLDPQFNPSPAGSVNALVLQADGKVVIGGAFNSIAPTRTTNTTTAGSDRAGTTTVTNADGTTTTTTISITGTTTTTTVSTTSTRNYLARLNADGTLDTPYNPNPNATVNALALQADGKILVGGQFTQLGTTVRNNLARINTDGGTDAAFDPNANAQVTSLSVQPDGRILVAGVFTTIQPAGTAALTRNGLARLTATGALDPTFDPNPNGLVIAALGRADGSVLLAGTFTALLPGGVMFVGGAFNNLGGIPARALVALNNDGSAYSGFAPNPNGTVNALLIQPDGKLVVGGAFTNIGGATRNNLARFNADGSLDTAYNPAGLGSVAALALQPDGKILVAGSPAGVSTTGALLARYNADGSRDAAFNATLQLPPVRLALQGDGRVLVLTNQPAVLRFNPDGSPDNTFTAAALNGGIASLALQADGRILVAGAFTAAAAPRLARLNPNGTLDAIFAPAPDANVTAVALQADGRVILGGAFKNVGAHTRGGIARLAATNGASQSLAFGPGGAGATRNLVWTRDGTAAELSSVSFETSTDARIWTTLAANGTRAAGGRGWQSGNVTVLTTAPFYVRARGLVASGTGTAGVVEYTGEFNLSQSAAFAGTALPPGADPALAASSVLDPVTGAPLFVQTSSAGVGDIPAGTALASVTLATGGDGGGVVVTSAPRLSNLSIRARVTSANPIITGFAITGTGSRAILLRAAGPSLAQFGVSGVLAAPRLRVFDAAGQLLLENAGWAATAANAAEVSAAAVRTGAFPFTANNGADAAAVLTLAPGAYSMHVLDTAGLGGVALAEIYDADPSATSRLVNVSTRNAVAPGEGAFLSGFVISGGTRNLLIRGIGPSLTQFGVANALLDPLLNVYDARGTLLASNDNWSQTTAGNPNTANPAVLAAAARTAGAFPLNANTTDSAVTLALAPGAYTVQVSAAPPAGQAGPAGTVPAAVGAAMIEVYELP
ncbi:MAG: hypothetical protein RLZZ15_4089, partial [Verrucomicrobiota bacterium]